MHGIVAAALLWLAALALSVSYPAAAAQTGRAMTTQERFAGVLDEHPAIGYATRQPTDAVARLAAAFARGEITLPYDAQRGYLEGVLRGLDISPDSQLLVFSRTGLQRAHTHPRNPRALYYNESTIVGFIPGAEHLEIATHDSQQGVIFYTVNQQLATAPKIERRTNCIACHVSGSTLDVPGVITRSNFTNANGDLLPQLGFTIVDHRTPLPQRWGGWFVTGTYDLAPYGGVTHLGNVSTAMHPVNDAPAGTSNEILHRWLETDAAAAGYPSHDSDIAALMLFDHQMRAINLLTRLNWEARVAAYEGRTDFTQGEVKQYAEELADYLLFTDEVPPPARLTPSVAFAAHFQGRGPRTSDGRSLRELDLNSRLLKYGCSYMIYSPAFDALPEAVRHAVYRRMRATLAAGDPARARDVNQILRETKADWPSLP